MNTLEGLCKSHRTRTFFDDGEGLIGVYNHRNVVLWHCWTVAGYSLVGETDTPEEADQRFLV